MMRILWSTRARADLDDIWAYGAARHGPDRTESYLRGIERLADRLAREPRSGRSAEDVRPGLMKASVGRHMVFFRLRDDELRIVRVLHEAMDHAAHIGDA
jgi:toxin ParE1/3/4